MENGKKVEYSTHVWVSRGQFFGRASVEFWVSEEIYEPVLDELRRRFGNNETFEVKDWKIFIRSNSIAGGAMREFAKEIEKEVRQIIREVAKRKGLKAKAVRWC